MNAPGDAASPAAASHILLTGRPGCGKTTVLTKAVGILDEAGCRAFGFTTPEIRKGRSRTGFAAELLDGTRDVLASREVPGPPRVGRYGVRTAVMDSLVAPELERGVRAAQSGETIILVMDEIGKMELFSQRFRQAVLSAFDSTAHVLASIMARSHPFADALKDRHDVEVITVTERNRDQLPTEIAHRLRPP